MGTVYRPFKEKTPDYRDDEVKEFLLRRGEDPTTYENYMVVPKTLALATKSILRYNKPPDPLDPEVKRKYNIAFDWLDRRFTPILSNSVVFDGPTAIELMPVKKSPGYPWSLEYQYKEDFYGTPEGEEFLEKYWELLATSDYIRSLASVSVKEEVRSTDKVMRQGKARTVMAFPVPHSHASKRLFRDQNRTLITQHGKLGSEVGIDPFHGGWHELVERHLKFTARRAGSAAMDGIEYDARFRYFIGKAIGRQRFKWLRRDFRTPENLQRIRNLYYDIFHAPIVGVDGEVHSRGTGNGSGQDSTTEDNGFKNFCDFVVMYLILVPEEYQDYDSFTEFVLLSFNGDDMNFSVKEKIQPWFNPKTIMAVSKAIGMEYTCEFEDYRLFTELSFIGHTSVLTNIPRFGHAMWLPIIDCSRMRSSMYIYNEDHNVYTSIVRACGLRNETFACKSCRVWFQDLIDFLRIRHGTSTDPAIVEAWKCYLYDWELWELYSGLKAEDVRVPHSGKALPRLNTNAPPQTTMPSSKKKKHVSIKKTTSSKKKASSSKKKAPYKRNSVLDGAAISASTAIVKEAATTVKQDAAISVRKDIEDVRAARAWIASLKEPNKYSPPCIGKGSLMVTNVTVMDLTCGSNGTAAAFLIPRGQNEIMLADGTLGPITAGTWTAYAGTQDSTLSTNYQTGRFAGMSIEWESRTSTDERPGWVNAGLLFGISNTTDITGLSGNMIMNLNGMLAYNGKSAYDGAVSWRPKMAVMVSTTSPASIPRPPSWARRFQSSTFLSGLLVPRSVSPSRCTRSAFPRMIACKPLVLWPIPPIMIGVLCSTWCAILEETLFAQWSVLVQQLPPNGPLASISVVTLVALLLHRLLLPILTRTIFRVMIGGLPTLVGQLHLAASSPKRSLTFLLCLSPLGAGGVLMSLKKTSPHRSSWHVSSLLRASLGSKGPKESHATSRNCCCVALRSRGPQLVLVR